MTNALVERTFDLGLWLMGAGHFVILTASFQVPYRLRWKEDLQQLMPFNRKLLWVQSGFTVLTIISFWHAHAGLALRTPERRPGCSRTCMFYRTLLDCACPCGCVLLHLLGLAQRKNICRRTRPPDFLRFACWRPATLGCLYGRCA
jgi:hypothetical protein